MNPDLKVNDTWWAGVSVPFEYKRVEGSRWGIERVVNNLTNDGWTIYAGYSRFLFEVVWMVRQK